MKLEDLEQFAFENRLPQEGQTILCISKARIFAPRYYAVYKFEEDCYWHTDKAFTPCGETKRFTHWIELPELNKQN